MNDQAQTTNTPNVDPKKAPRRMARATGRKRASERKRTPRGARGGPSGTVPSTLYANCCLMQNYLPREQELGEVEAIAVGSEDAAIHVVTIDDDKVIHDHFPKSKSSSGWKSKTLTLPKGVGAVSIVTASDAKGVLHFFAHDVNGDVWHRTVKSDWTAAGSFPKDVDRPALSAGLIGDTLVLIASYSKSKSDGRVYQIDFASSKAPWTQLTKDDARIYATQVGSVAISAKLTVSGVFYSRKTSSDGNHEVRFIPLSGDASLGNFKATEKHEHFSRMLSAPILGDTPEVYALTADGKLYWMVGTADARGRTALGKNMVDFDLAVDGNGVAHLLAVDSKHRLWHGTLGKGGWGELLNLTTGIDKVRFSNTGGILSGWCAEQGGGVLQLELDPKTGDWAMLPLLIPDPSGGFDDIPSYVCEVTVGDENGVPIAQTGVSVVPNANEVEILLDGRWYRLGPNDKPLNLQTNAAGKADFTMRATTLHAPQLLVWTAFLDDSKALLVEPNRPVLAEHLENLSADDLEGAKVQTDSKGTTKSIWDGIKKPSHDTRKAIAKAVRHSVALTEPNEVDRPESAPAAIRLDRSTRGTHVVDRKRAHQNARINAQAARGQHWSLRRGSDGECTFETHTRAEASQRIEAMLADGSDDVSSEMTLGDVLQAIISGNATLDAITVSDESSEAQSEKSGAPEGFFSKLRAAVIFVVDGAKKVIDSVIELVEQAVNVADAAFAAIELGFKRVYQWLGTLFNWQDILNSARVLRLGFTWATKSLPGLISSNQASVATSINNFLSGPPPQVPKEVQSSSPNTGAAQADKETASAGVPEDDQAANGEDFDAPAASDDPHGNWLLNRIVTELQSATSLFTLSPPKSVVNDVERALGGITVPATLEDGLKGFKDSLTATGGDVELGAMIQALGQDLGSALAQLLTGIIDAGAAAFVSILGWLDDLANTKLQIPWLSSLYEQVIDPGNELTLGNLITLVLAAPATILYKLFAAVHRSDHLPVAPFTTDKPGDLQLSLSEVLAIDFNAAMADAKLGLDKKSDDDVRKTKYLSFFAGIVYSVAFVFLAAVNFAGDAAEMATKKADYRPRVLAFLAGLIAQIVSVPYYPWWHEAPRGSAATEWSIWNFQWVFTALGFFGVVLLALNLDSALTSTITSLFGMVHAVFFVRLAIEEKSAGISEAKATADWVLKSVQNVVTAFDEILALFRVPIMKAGANGPLVAAALYVVTPGVPAVVNAARVVINMPSFRHVIV